VWGAVFTGLATFIFFGSALLLNAIFSKDAEPQVIYYRQVVFAAAAEPAPNSKAAKKKAREVLVRDR
jgi:hypothetical protein